MVNKLSEKFNWLFPGHRKQDNSMKGRILREKYRIQHKMGGNGGFGETFIARSLNSGDDNLYVVKKLKPSITDPRIWRQFSKEAEVLKELGKFHPQIPEVYDYFEQSREFYLVQEYIEGHDLTDEIKPGKRWDETQTKEFLEIILEILSFVHNRGILHMDIKPANIMRRNRDRQLILIDFGAVKRISTQVLQNGEIRSNPNSLVFCTPGYAPLEQLEGKPHFYSSDIYGLGITAIQALTGISAIELSKDNGTIVWQNEVGDSISSSFADFLSRMVCLDYRQRYQDAKTALQKLRNITDEIPDNSNEPTEILRLGFLPQDRESKTIPPLEVPNGPVALNSPFYIERSTGNLYSRSTALRRIKAPRKWGKTSTVIRIINREKQQGFYTVCLNFQEFDTDTSQSLGIFLQKFCESIIQELNETGLVIENNVAEHWENALVPNNKAKCRIFIQKYILTIIDKPLVIVLDEVDRIFGNYQIEVEFFALLRVFYERSASEQIWQKLKMIIVHSQDYTETSKNKSPFNVGESIELPEFDKSQVQELLVQHGLNWQSKQVEQLIELVGGHPYMVRVALYKIANQEMTFSKFLELAPTEAGPFSGELLYHWDNLEKYGLKNEYRKVLGVRDAIQIDAQKANILESMGLIKRDENNPNKVQCFCQLYRLYFQQHLGLKE